MTTFQGQHASLPSGTDFSGMINDRLICASQEGTLTSVDLTNGAVIKQTCLNRKTTCAAFVSSSIFIATEDKEILVIDPLGLSLKRELFKGTTGQIYALAASPDGRFLAAGDNQRRIHLYDLSNKQVRLSIQRHG